MAFKRTFYFSAFVVMLLTVTAGLLSCQNKNKSLKEKIDETVMSDTGKAKIIFREYEHDFGKVEEGEKIGCLFNFTNEGTSDLVIKAALTSCGCTVSKYSSKPIKPGEEGTLEVTFDTSGRSGIQTKVITVKSNAAIPVVLLKITADVSLKDN